MLSEPGAGRIKAVIPVHLYGHPADIAGIRSVLDDAGRGDVTVIGDAAQAHGLEGVGGLTDISCYSFYPAKNLGALGDGGMVLCSDEATEKRLRSLRNHGRGSKHDSIEYGLNSRFDEIQAAVLRIKLRRLREWNGRRRQIASRYRASLSDLPMLTLPKDHADHVYHLFVIELAEGLDRDAVVREIKARGVGVALHYPIPVHSMSPYPSDRALPVTDRQCAGCMSLPIFPGMRTGETDLVCHVVRSVLTEMSS
jgi:dTDP-3-amino-3,4,6-trideoxy-alpha-D-glucose transaminase